MEEIYRTLNRLKSRGMKGWHATKQEWLIEQLEGYDTKEFNKFLQIFLYIQDYNRRVLTMETVVEIMLKAMQT